MLRKIARNLVLTPNTIRYRIEVRILAELINTLPGKSLGDLVLDAGAGSGEMSMRVKKLGLCGGLVGVEPDPALFKLLQSNYGSSNHPVHQGGLDRLPLDDASVDGVMSTQVFEHVEDDQTAASEVARVLKPGGYAIISTPHPPEIFPNDGHLRPGYTVEEMRALFEDKGLKYIDHRYFFTLPTLRRLMAAGELGWFGKFFPIGWADREKGLSQKEMFAQQPYGIACLFRKS